MLQRARLRLVAIAWIGLSATLAKPAPARGTEHCCLAGYIPPQTIAKVAARFNRVLHDDGMIGVTSSIQPCYDLAKTLIATSECMLFDIVAYNLDQGMQVSFTARGLNAVSANRMLSQQAFAARMTIYSDEVFGSEQAGMTYFGSAPSQVLNAIQP